MPSCFDRGIKAVERHGATGPVDRWRDLRAEVIPLVGFLPATDPRVVGTVSAIERALMWNGFVQRYIPKARERGPAEERKE